jgi:hypothetical protein
VHSHSHRVGQLPRGGAPRIHAQPETLVASRSFGKFSRSEATRVEPAPVLVAKQVPVLQHMAVLGLTVDETLHRGAFGLPLAIDFDPDAASTFLRAFVV